MGNIRLGVVGIGRIGRLHVDNIQKLVDGMDVVAVADINVAKQQEWLEGQNIAHVYSNYEELIANPDVDAVLIACSTTLHYDVCMAAAKAKKHVFCEKPLDPDIGRSLEMIAACEAAGVVMQVGFNRRFDHNHKKVRDLVQAGAVGQPHIIRIASRDPAAPPVEYVKTSGGMFLDMTIHDFDMIRYLSGSEVEEVYAMGAVLIDPAIGNAGDIDTAVITLRMKNGALGVIDNSRQAVYGYDQRIEVFGSKGQVLDKNDKPTNIELSTAETETSDKIRYFFLDRYTQAFVDEFAGFVQAVTEGTPPLVDGNDCVQAMRIAHAAMESLKTGLPVKL